MQSWGPIRAISRRTGRAGERSRAASQRGIRSRTFRGSTLSCSATTLSSQENLPRYYRINDRGGGRAPEVQIPDATGRGYRLATEAEWEWACRARTTTGFAFEDDPSKLPISAWFVENAQDRPHPVGEKRKNGFGLFDMYGNVAEWCWDGFADYPADDVDNPSGPVEARERIVRGGSYRMGLEEFRPAIRGRKAPTDRDRGLGFRVARYSRGSRSGFGRSTRARSADEEERPPDLRRRRLILPLFSRHPARQALSIHQHVMPSGRSVGRWFRSMLKNGSTFMPSGPMCTSRT